MVGSVSFNQNINPPPGVPRKTFAEVIYSFTEPESKDGGETVFPPANIFSRQHQVLNGIVHMSAPVATLEPDNWRLDGSFILPVLPHVQTSLELGFWSAALSDERGVFHEPLVFSHEFDKETDFDTLGIFFDTLAGNWCTDFEVSFFDFYGRLLYSERITGNDSAIVNTSRAALNIKKIVITLFKTNKPFHFARLKELNFGAHIVYGGDLIQSVNSLYEADISGRRIPIPSFSLRIRNKGVYDVLDPESVIRYFQTRQRFNFMSGLRLPNGSVEFVSVGNFFLESWNVTDDFVNFKAGGVLALLDKVPFIRNGFHELNINEFARSVYHHLDITVSSPPVTAFLGDISVRDALVMLAELSCCLVFEDGNNTIRFVDVLQAGPAAFGVGYQNMFSSPKINIAEYFNAVLLTEYTAVTELRQVANLFLEPGFVEIRFTRPIKGEPEIYLDEGFYFTDVVYFAGRLTGLLNGTGICEVTVFGEAVTFTKNEVMYNAPWHNGREVTVPYKVDLPCMVVTPGFPAFRDWFLRRKFGLLLMRLEASFSWQQNPAVFVGDSVNVQVHNSGTRSDMCVVRQEINFNGSLRGETRAVSALPIGI